MPTVEDPQLLRHRLAYRLAKHGFTARQLHERKIGPRSLLRDLTKGRAKVSETDVAQLAEQLNLEADTLMSPLTVDEFNTWSFDSASTRHRLTVWRNARKAWIGVSWSWRDAASTLKMSEGRLHDAFNHQSSRRLLYPKALLLSSALTLENGPRAFLEAVPHRWAAFSLEPQSSRHTARDV